MKKWFPISLCLFATILVFSCQKELSFGTEAAITGTLKADSTGVCLPATIIGLYKVDSVLDSRNYIEIQMNVASAGSYKLQTDSVNGFRFKGEGIISATGLTSIRLYANGKPLAAGVSTFTVSYGTSSCKIKVTVVSANTTLAVYTLAGAPAICDSAVISGVYKAGTALNATNTIKLKVNVTVAGPFTIGATSLPVGLVFAATGTFTQTGVQTITLTGIGTPAAAGIVNLVFTNLTSNCTLSLIILPAGGGTAATYSLTCNSLTVNGTYLAGTVLGAANTITLNANVTATGTYTITATPVVPRGYTFTGTGTFTATGSQAVVLNGVGTPSLVGVDTFNISGGGTTCQTTITVGGTNPPPPPTNLQYIPETVGSNWTYTQQGGAPGDTTHLRVSSSTIVKSSQTYRIFEYLDNGAAYDSTYHRNNAGKYYEYYGDIGFDNPVNKEVLLLDSTLAVNATWVNNLGANAIGGIPVTTKITNKIIAKGATATIAGTTYTNIIKVTYTYAFDLGFGFTDIYLEEIWYAKGKGQIYYKGNDVPPANPDTIIEATRIQIL